jgi:hypothetical protein
MVFRVLAGHDLAQAVGVSFYFVLTDPACKCLSFKIMTAKRVRPAPRQAHQVFAFRTDRVIGRAKAGWHGDDVLLMGRDQLTTRTRVPFYRQLKRESGLDSARMAWDHRGCDRRETTAAVNGSAQHPVLSDFCPGDPAHPLGI